MNRVKFGPAGNCESFSRQYKSTLDAPAWLAARGLSAYEYQCGRGVNIGTETAQKLGAAMAAHGIALSLHSPYYINLSSPDPAQQEKNLRYLLQSARAADAMGARRIVVHPGAAGGGADRPEALARSQAALREALVHIEAEGFADITLCPETMGKLGQLGTMEEVLELCARDERLLPCVDFGHLYARSHGADEGYEATARLLDKMEQAIGLERARVFHSHFSQIEYSAGGEVRHLIFGNGAFGPDFAPLAKLLRERDYAATIICESAGTQAEDAMDMKRLYEEATP